MFFIKRLLNVVRRIDQSKLFSMSKIEIAKLLFYESAVPRDIKFRGYKLALSFQKIATFAQGGN